MTERHQQSSAATESGLTAKQAMEIGMKIADDHDTCLQEMAKAFYPDIPIDQLRKLIHGNKVWLGAQIMVAMQAAETAVIPVAAQTEQVDEWNKIHSMLVADADAVEAARCSAGNAGELLKRLWSQIYDKRPEGDPKDTYRALAALLNEPQGAKESERSAAIEPFIKKMDWPLGGLPDTDVIQCRVVTPNFTTGGDQKASFGLTVADFRKLREAFQPGGTLKERTQWVADILEDASSPLTRPAPHTAANPLSFDDRDKYIDELEAQIERLRSRPSPHEPRKP